ncbi:hypothetical protein GCM10010305_60040 [Streptomyces termitum]|uniref:Uncharacterized protein n=1 Tax=Streptomyces termitum TaxID=67368 RepID=A0A918T7M6_9ACTN|nr:hypothetical protein GCM10010305_60040 [Streptomyces termitum]
MPDRMIRATRRRAASHHLRIPAVVCVVALIVVLWRPAAAQAVTCAVLIEALLNLYNAPDRIHPRAPQVRDRAYGRRHVTA